MAPKIPITVFLMTLFLFVTNGPLSAQDSEESGFNLSFAAKYLNRFTAYGIDMAGESAAWRASATLSHQSGFYIDGYYTVPTSNLIEDGNQGTFDVGYEAEISDIFSVYAEYAQYFYSSDTVNIFSQYNNSISLNAAIDLEILELGFSYDRFLGNDGASYFSLDISSFQEAGPFYLMPMLQMVFMSQTIEERYLDKGKGKKGSGEEIVTSTTLTGLSNSSLTLVLVYPAAKGLTLSLVPSLIFYHQNELSVESTRFLWNAGLRYSFDL